MGATSVQDAVQVSSFDGGPGGWGARTSLVRDKAVPRPGPGDVVVRMRMRAVHPADTYALMGFYPGFQPASFPATPGHEGMGQVATLGEGVTGLTVGQRVVPLLFDSIRRGEGGWQQFVCLPAHDVFPIPDAVSDEAAAQLVINPLTAYGLIKDLAPPKGEYILQTAGNSVFARQVIALARHWGIKTINVVRRSESIPEIKALGGDEVISSGDEDVVARVAEITGGKMAYGAIDPVAGTSTKTTAACVRSRGTVFVFGALEANEFTVKNSDVVFRMVTIKGWWVFNYADSLSKSEKSDAVRELLGFLESGLVQPLAGEAYPLADFAKAVQAQHADAKAAGKLLLVD